MGRDFAVLKQLVREKGADFNLLSGQHHLLVLAHAEDPFDRFVEPGLVKDCKVGEASNAARGRLGETHFVCVGKADEGGRAVVASGDGLALQDAGARCVDFGAVALATSDVWDYQPI